VAYGVLRIKAFVVEMTAVRRAATENNFIAAMYDGGFEEWERGRGRGGGGPCVGSLAYLFPHANLRGGNDLDP